jgi:hypothetical protein
MPKRIGTPSTPVKPAATQPKPKKVSADQPAPARTGGSWAPKADSKPASFDAAAATLDQLKRSLPKQAFDLKTPATRAAGNVTTGTGAKAQLKLDAFQPQMTASGYVMPYKLSVVYADPGKYFGGAKSVQVWAQLHGTDGAVATTLEALKLDKQRDGTYVGTAFITQKAQGSAGLRAADLAFSAGGKWDSNQGQNYHLPL